MAMRDRTLIEQTQAEAPASPGRNQGLRGLIAFSLALGPALLAIAMTPGFTTQDGPAHVYSARILNDSLGANSPFAATFQVVWQPLPNWVGHFLTMLAVAVASPEVANRIVTALTLIVFAGSIFWLRWVVAGGRGIEIAAVLAALLGLNVTWLLGFTSFVLGASVGSITLASWWLGREDLSIGRTLWLAILLVLGYFCHPISLGLTVGGLGILALSTPGSRWRRRLVATVVSGLPLVPLGLAYRAMTRSGGALEPIWEHWTSPWLGGIFSQLGWVDPLSLAAKSANPFDFQAGLIVTSILVPVAWIVGGLVVLVGATWGRHLAERRGWLILAVGLICAGLIAPDTLGVKHGHYMPQRIVLIGLVALVPWLDLREDRRSTWIGGSLLGVALVMQSAFVWDYAQVCRERILPFLRVVDRFDGKDRSGTLLNSIPGRFRANPLLHADGLIAAATDSVFWTNYETAQYYFPVKVRSGLDHPVATLFEVVALLDQPRDAARRAQLWEELLARHGTQMNKIVEWRTDPKLEETTRRDYRVTAEDGPLRIWTRSNSGL